MQDRLAQHFLPAEATLLGCRLQPFTLWHWRTLAALGSPLFCDAPEGLTFEDLVVAVRVCTLPPNSPAEAITRALRVGPWDQMRLAYYRRFEHFDDLIETWFAYFGHYASGPQPVNDLNGNAAKAHPCMVLFAGLMSLGYSRADAWAETPGLARWILAGALEAKGEQLAIVSDSMIADARRAGYTEEQIGR
jgi:hypothetical protein